MKNKLEVAMNKLALGVVALAFLAGSIFAADSYYVFSESNVAAWGTGNYVFGYTFGTVTLGNPDNPHSTGDKDFINEGVGKIINATVATSPASGVVIAVKTSGTATNGKSITDCVNGFSYWYRGGAHNFHLEYPKSNCSGADADKWNNKWRYSVTTASAANWTKKTVSLADFAKIQYGACDLNLSASNLNIIEQITWGTEEGVSSYNLMIGNVACLGSGAAISDATPSATISTTWVASADTYCTGYYCKWNDGCGLIKTDNSAQTPITTCDDAISNCLRNSPDKKVYSNSTCTVAIAFSSSSVAAVASSSSRASSSSVASSSSRASSSSVSGGSSSSVGSGGSSSSVGSGGSSSSDDGDDEPIISYNKTPVAGLSVVSFARNLQIASAKDATVALFNMHGRQVFSQKVFSGTTTLSLANQRQGVYYAVVKSGSHKQTVKVVLK